VRGLLRSDTGPGNITGSLMLTGILRFEPASRFANQDYDVVICILNIQDLISKNQ
jgi:hypothetical protein